MQHSILFYGALAYGICSGGIALAGLGALAILHFRPTSSDAAVKLFQLGTDAPGIGSETLESAPLREH